MSDTEIEPISKRLRNRSGEAVPRTPPSTTNEPASNKSHDKKASNKKQETKQPISLLGRNDKCLEKLFEHLDVETLCHMANVCKRFQQIAEKVFAQQHTEFVLEGSKWKNSVFRRVLCKFGHLITSIDASQAHFVDGRIDTDAIAKYCPTKLEKLSLRFATIDCAAFKPLFARLKELMLDSCDFVGNKTNLFTNCSKLEYLCFEADEDTCEFVAQKYPKLTGMAFDSNFSSSVTFYELLPLNPQLKRLHIMTLPDDIYISSVVQHLKHLERLKIRPGYMFSMPEIQTKKVFLQLVKLKNLKKLALNAGYETYAKLVAPLVDALVKGKVALDELDLREFEIGSKEIQSITNLKTLEVLLLDRIKDVLSADLIPLTTKLPLLINLQLDFGYESKAPITVDGLTKMVKVAKQLKFIALVGIRNVKINQKEFEALLKAAKSRGAKTKLIIQIIGCKTTTSFNVPENVQQASAKQLKIVYEEDQGQCGCDSCPEHDE